MQSLKQSRGINLFLVPPAGAVTSSEPSPHLIAYRVSHSRRRYMEERAGVKISLGEQQVQHHETGSPVLFSLAGTLSGREGRT